MWDHLPPTTKLLWGTPEKSPVNPRKSPVNPINPGEVPHGEIPRRSENKVEFSTK